MFRRKVATTTFVLSALAAFAVGPFAAKGATVGTGSTSTVLGLVDVNLTNVPVAGNVGAALGIASSEATTSGTPEASIGIDGITVAGQTHGSRRVSSKDGDSAESVNVPLDAAGISGLIEIAQIRASATDDTAEAVLSALNGDINIGPLGIGTSVSENGIHSLVDGDGSSSTVGASFGPISLDLGDVVSADLLGQLPLTAVLDLVDSLGLDLPAGIDEQLSVVTDLLDTVDALDMVMGQLDAAEAELMTLVEGIPSVDAAEEVVALAQAAFDQATAAAAALDQQIAVATSSFTAAQSDAVAKQSQVDALTSELSGAQTQKAILEGQLAICGGVPDVCDPIQNELNAVNTEIAILTAQLNQAQDELAEAQAAMAAAQAEIDAATAAMPAAQAAVETAANELAAAQAALEATIAQVSTPEIDQIKAIIDNLEEQLESLLTQIGDLLDGIGNLDALLDSVIGLLDDVEIFSIGEVTVRAESSADATRGTAAVVCETGVIEVLGNPVGGGGCDEINAAFGQLRSAVNDVLAALPVGGSLPKATFEGLTTSTSASDAPNADGVTEAVAKLTALHIKVPSVSLKDVVDDVLASAIATIEDVIAQLPGDVPVPVDLQTVIDQVMTQIEGLPIGDTLAGLRTMGIDVEVASLTSSSTFQSRAPQTVDETDEDDIDDPVSTGTPGERSELPFTGAPTSLVFALALWLMVAGMVAMVLGERKAATRRI